MPLFVSTCPAMSATFTRSSSWLEPLRRRPVHPLAPDHRSYARPEELAGVGDGVRGLHPSVTSWSATRSGSLHRTTVDDLVKGRLHHIDLTRAYMVETNGIEPSTSCLQS